MSTFGAAGLAACLAAAFFVAGGSMLAASLRNSDEADKTLWRDFYDDRPSGEGFRLRRASVRRLWYSMGLFGAGAAALYAALDLAYEIYRSTLP